VEKASLAIVLVAALAGSACSDEARCSALSRLPSNNEIGNWTISEGPTVVNTDVAFYNLIDGAAPKYIARGWVSSVYATYRQGGGTIQVNIHDMGTPGNAEGIFTTYLPPERIEISYTDGSDPGGRRPNAVVDLGLPTAYQATAFTDHYYVEVNIDDRSDAALVYVKTFVLQIINRCQ
jgi:hypothetical protein